MTTDNGATHVADLGEVMVCAVCGRPLNTVMSVDTSLPDGSGNRLVGWRHGMQELEGEDHPAIPVRQGQVPLRGRCDFCNAEDPIVSLPVANFIMPGPQEPGGGQPASAGDWAACKDCAVLVARHDWQALIRRVRAEQRKRGTINPPEVYAALAGLYREIEMHIAGPLRPL